ncbi:MAG: hypothetical protein Q9195_001214 [Heterodermia aff. obscurata]
MGQRHQLFIIAKIDGRYRGLAALHNQRLNGLSAVARCCRTLQVFQAAENRIPIQQELLAARSRPEAFWNRELTYDYRRSDCAEIIAPFPFISTALTLGSSFDPFNGVHDRVFPLQFNTPFDGGDNNDGVTIIDVTQPAHPRYCFVFFEELERVDCEGSDDGSDDGSDHESDDESDDEPDDEPDDESRTETYTPLSASDYFNTYVDNGYWEISEQSRELLESMKQWPLIDIATLDQTWPRASWRSVSGESGSVGLIDPEISDFK